MFLYRSIKSFIQKPIARKYIFYRLSSFFRKNVGVVKVHSEPPIIVSLTSIPSRLNVVHLAIESIL